MKVSSIFILFLLHVHEHEACVDGHDHLVLDLSQVFGQCINWSAKCSGHGQGILGVAHAFLGGKRKMSSDFAQAKLTSILCTSGVLPSLTNEWSMTPSLMESIKWITGNAVRFTGSCKNNIKWILRIDFTSVTIVCLPGSASRECPCFATSGWPTWGFQSPRWGCRRGSAWPTATTCTCASVATLVRSTHFYSTTWRRIFALISLT